MPSREQLRGNRADPTPEEFWQRVDRTAGPEGCWPWLWGCVTAGYGEFRKNGRPCYAHREAYELTNEPLDPEISVLHRCDNPPCCNPAHLFPGTDKDNSDDKINKGRSNIGMRHGMAKFSDELVLEAAAAYQMGAGSYEIVAKRFGMSVRISATSCSDATGDTFSLCCTNLQPCRLPPA